ncbi:MAG: hypothetical protein OXM56_11475 [Gammaproteobacteria bacterium]|nr:hypothetical protein [Gammaproteobacteria bacterium]
MSTHPFYYSMVLDGHPLHPYQADTLAFTLERFGNVPAERIVAHCTDRVPQSVARELRLRGLTVIPIAPYLDGKYCNKITQLDHFTEAKPVAEGVFLFDLDVAVLSPLDVPDRNAVWGKIVDDTNPELELVQHVFRAAGVPLPEVVPCDWSPPRGNTIATNFNGGLLYVPLASGPTLRRCWRAWAEYLFEHDELLAAPADRSHIDQISFAMALASEGLPYGHLNANWNFPGHYTRWPRSFDPERPLHALHYHDCLDEFGLVAPTFSHRVVDEATERLNQAIGQRPPSLFFDLYKRHLAARAVDGVPDLARPLFPASLTERAAPRGRKRRLVLHAGTPKTGSSSLQRCLDRHRATLASQGWWYPPVTDPREPKHQDLVWALQQADAGALVDCVGTALKDMPDDTHTVVLSTEGIFNHWWDYTPRARAMLRDLATLFDFEMCICFRSPDRFAVALYAQYLRNPARDDAPANVYGCDIDFSDALGDPWFRRHLDYLGFCYEAGALLGHDRVRALLVSDDTVSAFLACYGILDIPQPGPRENPSMHAAGIEIMRIANRFNLSESEHRRVEELTRQIDEVIGARSEDLPVAAEDLERVRRYSARGWATLQASSAGRTPYRRDGEVGSDVLAER